MDTIALEEEGAVWRRGRGDKLVVYFKRKNLNDETKEKLAQTLFKSNFYIDTHKK